MYALSVSGAVVEGAGGEIRRLREANGKLTGQGKPAVAHCHGRLKAEGRVSATCHGLAASPQYREVESTGHGARQVPPLFGFNPAGAGVTS